MEELTGFWGEGTGSQQQGCPWHGTARAANGKASVAHRGTARGTERGGWPCVLGYDSTMNSEAPHRKTIQHFNIEGHTPIYSLSPVISGGRC